MFGGNGPEKRLSDKSKSRSSVSSKSDRGTGPDNLLPSTENTVSAVISERVSGSEPLSELCEMSSRCSRCMLPSSSLMVPFSWLSSSHSSRVLFIEYMELGIEPVSPLASMASRVTDHSELTVAGILPPNLFALSKRTSRLESCITFSGSEPVSLLNDMERSTSLLILPNPTSATMPVRAFALILRPTIMSNSARTVGTVPFS